MTFGIGKELISEAEARDPVRGASIWYRSILFFHESCVAIDVACFIRLFGCNADVQGRTEEEAALQVETHGNLLTCFFQFLAFLLDFDVLPLLVFEGKTPKLKEAEVQSRTTKREHASDEKASLRAALRDAQEHEQRVASLRRRRERSAASAIATTKSLAAPTRYTAMSSSDATMEDVEHKQQEEMEVVPSVRIGSRVGAGFKLVRIPLAGAFNAKLTRAIEHQMKVHRRNNFRPRLSNVNALKELVRLMGLPFIQAPYEMDWVAGQLRSLGVILGGAGTDHDFICHNVPLVRDLQIEMYSIERLWYTAAYGSVVVVTDADGAVARGADTPSPIRPRDVVDSSRRVEVARPAPKPAKKARGKKRKSNDDNYEVADGSCCDGAAAESAAAAAAAATASSCSPVVPAPALCYQVPGHVRVFDPQRVSEVFQLCLLQIIDLCNAMGNDYCGKTGIRGVGFVTARELLQRYGSLDAILQQRPLPLPSNAALPCATPEEYQQLARQARSIFLGHPDKTLYPDVQEPPTLTQPVTAFDVVALSEFVRIHHMLPPRRYSGLSCEQVRHQQESPLPTTASTPTPTSATEPEPATETKPTATTTSRPWRYMYTLDDYTVIRSRKWGERMAQMQDKTTLPAPAQLRRLSELNDTSSDDSELVY